MNKQRLLRWHVLYTRGRHEKAVAQQLEEKKIEVYVPITKQLRQWSDRKKWIDVPLFPNYVFIRANDIILSQSLQTPGVVKIVHFAGKAAVIREIQMKRIKRIIENSDYSEIEMNENHSGLFVKIKSGPFKGLSGILLEKKGKYKLSVRIEDLNASILVEINLKNIVKSDFGRSFEKPE